MKVIVARDIVKYHGGDLKVLSGATLAEFPLLCGVFRGVRLSRLWCIKVGKYIA